MKIVISTKHFLPMLGGSINYAVMLAGAFHQQGAEVVIMTRTPGSENAVEGYTVVRRLGLKKHFELAKWADVLLQVEASWKDVWPFLLRGVPWFPTLHCGKKNGWIPLKARLANFGLGIAYRMGNTIPVSYAVGRDWNIKGKPIQNPYDAAVFHPPADDAVRTVDLLFVGRIERSKGVFVLVDALRQIVSDLDMVLKCCFVGEGADDQLLRETTSSFGSGIQFEHMGRLNPREVAERMRISDILVFPTTPAWIEASPLTPLEALACGCRIIAADSGGTSENIGPGGTLVASGEVAPLAEAIRRALINPQIRDKEAVNAFLQTRNLNHVAGKYLERFSSHLNKEI